MFAITDAKSFLNKVTNDYDALQGNIADSGLAMNCILSTYHLHEWVWAHWLKNKIKTNPTIVGHLIRNKNDFISWLSDKCPHFDVIQNLANGSKHCSPVHSTSKIEGFGMGPYGIGPYNMAYLLVDMDDNGLPADKRYLVASEILKDSIAFWKTFFENYIP